MLLFASELFESSDQEEQGNSEVRMYKLKIIKLGVCAVSWLLFSRSHLLNYPVNAEC
jgi:hypothetical protein